MSSPPVGWVQWLSDLTLNPQMRPTSAMPQTEGHHAANFARGIESHLHKLTQKKNKTILKNCHRPHDGHKGFLRSRTTMVLRTPNARRPCTQLKHDRHWHQPHRRRGSQATSPWGLTRQKGERREVREYFHWTVCVWHGNPGLHLRKGKVVIRPEDANTEVRTEDSLRKTQIRNLARDLLCMDHRMARYSAKTRWSGKSA